MAERQLPCPDCGAPVRPDSEQLCQRCGYPLMFLRQPAEQEAPRAVPRKPLERDDGTGLMPPPVTRTQRAAVPAPVPGERPCHQCGYGNDPARIRCERCGVELRVARPRQVVLGPHQAKAAPRRGSWWWLIALMILAAISLFVLAAVLVYVYLIQ